MDVRAMNPHDAPWEDAVEIPLNGVLDLHAFRPGEAVAVVEATISACLEKGLMDLRIIHGKGRGVLRDQVHSHLRKHPDVVGFGPAPAEAGGWGATLVRLGGRP